MLSCRVIVVMDGYNSITENGRLKKGKIEAGQAEAYAPYKENVKALILERFSSPDAQPKIAEGTVSYFEAEFGEGTSQGLVSCKVTQFLEGRVSFIEPQRCIGFGLAVRSALRITTTPYVWVHQHDWTLETDLPLDAMIQVMRESESGDDPEAPIRYICLPGGRMLSYATSDHVTRYPALREYTAKLGGEYSPRGDGDTKIPLTPLFFWHDKPHIASAAHYLQRAFPSSSSIRRGEFIEDTIGQQSRNEMKQGQVSTIYKLSQCCLSDGFEIESGTSGQPGSTIRKMARPGV